MISKKTFKNWNRNAQVGDQWSTNVKVTGDNVDPPKWTFSGEYISALRGAAPSIFTCATAP